MPLCVWRSESGSGVHSFLPPVGPGDWTKLVRLGGVYSSESFISPAQGIINLSVVICQYYSRFLIAFAQEGLGAWFSGRMMIWCAQGSRFDSQGWKGQQQNSRIRLDFNQLINDGVSFCSLGLSGSYCCSSGWLPAAILRHQLPRAGITRLAFVFINSNLFVNVFIYLRQDLTVS